MIKLEKKSVSTTLAMDTFLKDPDLIVASAKPRAEIEVESNTNISAIRLLLERALEAKCTSGNIRIKYASFESAKLINITK
jgi:hypothetical protein